MIETLRAISIGLVSVALLILSVLFLGVVVWLTKNVLKEWRRRP